MMLENKVSIIVPIYKVEKYLRKCIDSIVRQTYRNLEIILVNDGSPDRCGEMAEEYAKTDPRIIVKHKENGGLSDARNHGMQYATGEYTAFVDSDDWMENTAIEEMVQASLAFQADVVQTAFYYAHEDHLLFDGRHYQKDGPPLVFGKQEWMRELVLNERVKNFAWGKLYKTALLQDLPFKKGVLFEDVFWAHRIMDRAETFVLLNRPLYYYLQRNDSIVANYTPRNLDILKGLGERHVFIEKHYPDLADASRKVILETSLIHYNLLFLNRKKDPEGRHRKGIHSNILKHYREFSRAVRGNPLLKRQLRLFAIHPSLNLVFLFLRKVLRKGRILPRPVGLERISLSLPAAVKKGI